MATRRRLLASGLIWAGGPVFAGPVARLGNAVFPEVIFSGPTNVPNLALTIDDGPDPVTTPGILDALDAVAIKATFMLIGENAEAAPEMVREIVARGHEIGHHMNRDEMTARLSDAELEAGMARTAAFLRQFAPVHFLRPGWGVPSGRIVEAARRHDLRVVVGNVAPMDTSQWQRELARPWFRMNVRPGAILTVHDVGPRGINAAALIRALVPEAQGLRFVTLTELVGPGDQSEQE